MHRSRLLRWFRGLQHRSLVTLTSYAFGASEALVNATYLIALLVMPTCILAVFLFTAHMMLCNAVGH